MSKAVLPLKLKLPLCAAVFFLLVSALLFWQFSRSKAPKADIGHASVSSRLIYRPCDYTADDMRITCFYYRTHASGGFYLPLALISQQRHNLELPDLLIQIPGGPGQGFMTSADEIDYWLDQIRTHHWGFDVLLYDPRGAGDGKEAWRCEALQTTTRELFARKLSVKEEYEVMYEVLKDCQQAFVSQLKNKNVLTSAESEFADLFSAQKQAEDLRGIIEALDYERVHLFGTSYGTRVALVAAEIPQVTSLILDAAYGFDQGLASQDPGLLTRAFEFHNTLFARWGESAESFDSLYAKLSEKLKQKPLVLELEHFSTGEKLKFVLTADRLIDVVFGSLYRSDTWADFYAGLVALSKGENITEEFRFVMESYLSNILDENFSYMVFFASECADNIQENQALLRLAFAEFPRFSDYYRYAVNYDACKLFPSNQTDVVQSRRYHDKPTLIFSGEFDPITPSFEAQALAEKLPRARHVEIKNTGHGVLFGGFCDLSFLSEFIEHADTDVVIECEDNVLWQ